MQLVATSQPAISKLPSVPGVTRPFPTLPHPGAVALADVAFVMNYMARQEVSVFAGAQAGPADGFGSVRDAVAAARMLSSDVNALGVFRAGDRFDVAYLERPAIHRIGDDQAGASRIPLALEHGAGNERQLVRGFESLDPNLLAIVQGDRVLRVES